MQRVAGKWYSVCKHRGFFQSTDRSSLFRQFVLLESFLGELLYSLKSSPTCLIEFAADGEWDYMDYASARCNCGRSREDWFACLYRDLTTCGVEACACAECVGEEIIVICIPSRVVTAKQALCPNFASSVSSRLQSSLVYPSRSSEDSVSNQGWDLESFVVCTNIRGE